jgi:hypothetical protein
MNAGDVTRKAYRRRHWKRMVIMMMKKNDEN